MHHYTNYDIIGVMEMALLMALSFVTASIDGIVHKKARGPYGMSFEGRGAVTWGIFSLIGVIIFLAADIFTGIRAFRHFQVAWIPVLLKVIVLAPFTNWLFLGMDVMAIWYLVIWYKAKGHMGEMLVPGVYYRTSVVKKRVQAALLQRHLPEMTEKELMRAKEFVDNYTMWFQVKAPKKYLLGGELSIEKILLSLRTKQSYQNQGETFDVAVEAIVGVYVDAHNRAVRASLVGRIRSWIATRHQNQKAPM